MKDDGATAVEYGLLLAVSVVIAGAVFLLAPSLSFGLPEFAKFGLGSSSGGGAGGGGTGGPAIITGSGAALGHDSKVKAEVGGPATCSDYPKPQDGLVVNCTRDSDGAAFTVTWTSAGNFDVNPPKP